MTTEDKNKEIWLAIQKLTSEGKTVSFTEDWGGWSSTVWIDKAHTHVGLEEGAYEDFVESLHSLLVLGRGLSFHKEDDQARLQKDTEEAFKEAAEMEEFFTKTTD